MKRLIYFLVFLVFVCFFLRDVYALGVSPAGRDFNFEPGLEQTVRFFPIGASPDQELEISTEGDLAKYTFLEKKSVFGEESFDVKFKLPDKIDLPGRHRIDVVVAQKIDPELAQGMINTRIVIIVSIDIYVPYPGRYLDVSLKGNDVNVGESVDFILGISSKGSEDVIVSPKIDIISQEGETKETLSFNERLIKSQESLSLQKSLNTVNYNPGKYLARAYVDYGALATADFNFKIGTLVINILNYTQRVPIDNIEKFEVEVESGWNSPIDGAYADVVISNGSQVLSNFKTTSTTLIPWERKLITGYIDTTNITEGVYGGNVTLFYYGREQGNSTSKLISVEFFKKKSLLLWYIVGGVGLLIIIILTLIKIFYKNGKRKK